MNERETEDLNENPKYTEDYLAGAQPNERFEDLRNKSSDELEEEIDHIRHEMDKTLSAIEKRFSRGEIIDRSLNYLQHGPGEYMANLGQAIKEKPLPVALAGIGLGWLMLAESGRTPGSLRTSSFRSDEKGETIQEMRGKVSETAHRAKEKMEGVSHAVSDRMHRMSERAQSSKKSAGEWGHRMGEMGHRSGERLHKVQNSFSQAVEDQPLILGVLGIAAGAIFGAMLPHTRQEDAMLGPAKERMKEQAAETGREQIEKAQAIAAAAAKSAREEADRQLH